MVQPTFHPLPLYRCALATLLLSAGPTAGATEAQITVRADRPGETISRYLYGQFAEHLGRGVYEGIWSEAYIAGNVGSGSPREMARWLEYMTADADTALARERRANGRDEPWRIAFFGVGNETWGGGGNMTPEYYRDLYKRYATFLKAPGGKPSLAGSRLQGAAGTMNPWLERPRTTA